MQENIVGSLPLDMHPPGTHDSDGHSIIRVRALITLCPAIRHKPRTYKSH